MPINPAPEVRENLIKLKQQGHLRIPPYIDGSKLQTKHAHKIFDPENVPPIGGVINLVGRPVPPSLRSAIATGQAREVVVNIEGRTLRGFKL